MINKSILVASLMLGLSIHPQSGGASVIGFLGNFDVINDTGSTAHGFEIELEGLHSSDITDTFGGLNRGFPTGRGFDPANSVQRYGSPSITEYANGTVFGTRVTYMGLFDSSSNTWDYGTPSVAAGTFVTPGDNCWSGGGLPGAGYGPGTPCDHFGVGTLGNPSKTTYSWLLETATPGVLTNGTVTLPAPAWTVAPAVPPVANAQPIQVVAQIQAPAPQNEAQFGEAIWVKVFTTELEQDAELEQLVGGNQVIDQAVTEIEWQLLQKDPGNPNSGQLESGLGAPVGPNAASIIRRYEFYKFAGQYDEETHEAKFAVGFGDSNPGPDDVGDYLGSQNAAVNLNVAAVPEPENVVLMLAGLGLIAFAKRRRHP